MGFQLNNQHTRCFFCLWCAA